MKRSLTGVLVSLILLSLAAFAGCSGKEAEVISDPVTVEIPEVTIYDEEEEPEVQVEYYGTVNTANTGVNIRATPSSDGMVIGTAEIGQKLHILELGDWCKVEFEDGEGYISRELLDITEEDPEAAETETEDTADASETTDETDTVDSTETSETDNTDNEEIDDNDVITRVVNDE